MTAGGKYEYLWSAPNAKPIRVSAPEYIDNVLSYVEGLINNEGLFPTLPNKPFPSNFIPEVKTAFKRLFRVFAHIYYHHFDHVKELGAEAHLNTCFKHFTLFALEFNLIEKKELAPLDDLIAVLLPDNPASNTTTSSNLPVTTTTMPGTVPSTTSLPSVTSLGAMSNVMTPPSGNASLTATSSATTVSMINPTTTTTDTTPGIASSNPIIPPYA